MLRRADQQRNVARSEQTLSSVLTACLCCHIRSLTFLGMFAIMFVHDVRGTEGVGDGVRGECELRGDSVCENEFRDNSRREGEFGDER